jgi:hypothetical protein
VSSYLDIQRACDRWLQKNCPQRSSAIEFGIKSHFVSKQARESEKIQPDYKPASTNKGGIRVQRDASILETRIKKPAERKKRSRAKYATEEERRAVMSEASKRRWASMTPEVKAEQIKKAIAAKKPKNTIPRHKRPEWKAYKLAWDRANKKPLTDPVKIQERRDAAKRRYHATDPEIRAKQHKIRRDKYRAKKKAQMQQ